MCENYPTTTDVWDRSYGQTDPEKNSTRRLVSEAVTLKGSLDNIQSSTYVHQRMVSDLRITETHQNKLFLCNFSRGQEEQRATLSSVFIWI